MGDQRPSAASFLDLSTKRPHEPLRLAGFGSLPVSPAERDQALSTLALQRIE
jgi:hypothetical protein